MQKTPSRDSSQPGFWDERFENKVMPWDKGGVPLALQEFVTQTERPLVTLIPGCGLGHEVRLLAQAGWDVTAIDFSAAAVASAKATIGEAGEYVLEADFFEYLPERALDLIYERAFLCALPPAMRERIAARWASLLPAGALLAGFFYIDDSLERSLKGPPFSISNAELQALLAPHFELQEQRAVTDSLAVFGDNERWQVWRRRVL